MHKDVRIFVAGHNGLLGSALIKRLHAEGYHNIIVKTHNDLELTDQHAVDTFFSEEKPEYVFLSAGLVGGIMANKINPATFLHTNIAIQDSVFEAARKADVRHLIFYGSSCMYPKKCLQPMKEEYLMTGEIEETSEGYAIAKIAGILACKAYNNQDKNNRFIALIPNSMYGPKDHFDLENSHVLSSLIRKFHEAKIRGEKRVILWGTGTPRREFIFHEDVADASIFAMKNADRLENCHYNVGTGSDYSIRELAEIIAEIVGFSGIIEWDSTKPDGTLRKLLDSTKFQNLGWQPVMEFQTGVKKTYEWYKNIDSRGNYGK